MNIQVFSPLERCTYEILFNLVHSFSKTEIVTVDHLTRTLVEEIVKVLG